MLTRSRTRGFTLIEVAVVLVVLAILAAIAIPSFNAFMNGVDRRAADFSVTQAMHSVEAKSAIDGSIYPISYADDVVPVFTNELSGDTAPTITHFNAGTGVLQVTVNGSRGTYDYFIDLADGQTQENYTVAAAPLTEAPMAPRVATSPGSANPAVLGVDLVNDNGNLYLVFDSAEYTNVRISRVHGSPGNYSWTAWQAIPATGTYAWPGDGVEYYPLVATAIQTSADGGNTWSDLRYVGLQLVTEAAGGATTAIVGDQGLWTTIRNIHALLNHPDDAYVYP